MKKSRLFSFVFPFAVASGFAAEPAPSASPAALLQQVTDAVNGHNLDAFAACFAKDYHGVYPSHPAQVVHSGEEVVRIFAGLFANVPDIRNEVVDSAVSGDKVWFEFRWVGHQRDGAPFEMRGTTVFTVAGGKFVAARIFHEAVDRPAATPSAPDPKFAVLGQLDQAMAAHDPDAVAACFAADYRSEQPTHPARAHQGAAVVRGHYVEIFKNVPDFKAETVRATLAGDTAWQEFRWSGHKRDGSLVDLRGMMVVGVSAGKIAWGRLYFEPVEQGGDDIDATIKRATR